MSGTRRGRLIVLEGPEGVGKSTQIERLAAVAARAGAPALSVREPGGTPLAEAIRGWLLDPRHEIDARAEALLFMAARADLVARVIEPALDAGRTVLADRFFLSTYAYQIAGRGLEERDVRAANDLATRGIVPDLTLLLVVPAAERAARAAARAAADRMEGAGADFHARVAAAFADALDPAWQRTHPECGPIRAIDGTGTPDEVHDRIGAIVGDFGIATAASGSWTAPPGGLSGARRG